MHIVEVAAEFAPIAKAGGLGEVLVGLSRELTRIGEKVEVILPKYKFLSQHPLRHLKVETPHFAVQELGKTIENTMWSTVAEDCSLRLLETHHPANYFDRPNIYGEEDDIARFLYFSRAVVEYLKLKKEPIDILHLHDWHVSAIAPLLRTLHSDIEVRAIVLTIHNVEYQGKCSLEDLESVGLKDTSLLQTEPGQYNLLKGGIEFADAIVPVSPSYAKEILTESHGFGLDRALLRNHNKIQGILNGIDLQLWDPSQDTALPKHYRALDAPEKITAAKQSIRESIADRFSLDAKKRPWIGAITRLVPQKGPEFIAEGLLQTTRQGGTFALLGSGAPPEIRTRFEKLKESHKGKALIQLEYNETLAHQLYAALDFLLVPSHFEPCGLTQMIAMRYGTIPIVHATGGLQDTVFDPADRYCDRSGFVNLEGHQKGPSLNDPSSAILRQYGPPHDHSNLNPSETLQNSQNLTGRSISHQALVNGFAFKEWTTESFNHMLEKVFTLWREDSSLIKTLRKHGMQTDFGWEKPALTYMKLFKSKLAQ